MLLGYCRVSTAEQARDDRTSLQVQEQVIRGMAMAKGIGAFDLAIYSDPAVSGAMPLHKRPSGSRLMADVKRGDTVVAAKLDRMFRSASDALNVVETFKERGIDLILYDMGIEPVNRSGFAECFFTMASAFAQLERVQIAERMLNGKKAKRERGGHAGGKPPYGFRIVGSKRQAVLEPVPEEQQIVDEIRALAGHSPTRIVRTINERGLRTRIGTPFSIMQVQRILRRAENNGVEIHAAQQ